MTIQNTLRAAQNYTDVQGLESLRHENKVNPNEGKIQVAKQFEALFLEMVVSSMRQANQALKSEEDEEDGSMSVYQDLFDKQLSQVMSQAGTGLSSLFLTDLNHQKNQTDTHAFGFSQSDSNHFSGTSQTQAISSNLKISDTPTRETQHVSNAVHDVSHSTKTFIQTLWQEANLAAKQIGMDPAVLLAQAGLETHWGEKILKRFNGVSSNNLFNIKSNTPTQDSVRVQSLEQQGDALIKESAQFKTYQNTKDSFQDYIHLIKNHVRYQSALQVAAHPLQFLDALQQAGYATDTHYAEKIKSILLNPRFQHWIQTMKNEI